MVKLKVCIQEGLNRLRLNQLKNRDMEEIYEPYGDQWVAEMKKWSKDLLIEKLRDALIERAKLKSEYDDAVGGPWEPR